MFSSRTIRNPTDGGAVDGGATVNPDARRFVQHQPTGGGATAGATAADAAAGPSAATGTSTSFLDDKTAGKCNETTPKVPTASTTMMATSSSNGATASAKSSNDAAISSTTDPSPSTSSEEWHSASSCLLRTPFSSGSGSSSFYATPGTTSTSATAEAGNRTGTTTCSSSTSIEVSSSPSSAAASGATSDGGNTTDARKKLQWTPPPSADNKWARLGLPVNAFQDNITANITGKGRSRSSSFDAEAGSIQQHQPSTKKSKTSIGTCTSSVSSFKVPRKTKKTPKKQVLLGNLQRSLDRALASPRDMYGSPDDLNVVEEKAGIIGMSPTATETAKSSPSSSSNEKVATQTNDVEMVDATIGPEAGEPMKNAGTAGTDVDSNTGIESFMPRQIVLKDASQKNPNVDTNEAISTPLASTQMPPKVIAVTSVSGDGKSIGNLTGKTHQRNGGATSNDGNAPSPANLLTLPDSHTKDATFPPSCPVLVYGHVVASVFTGKVASVCIDVSPGSDRSLLYCVKPDLLLPGFASKITVVESKIRFAPDCPVIATLNGRSTNGTVRSMCELDEGRGPITMYTIHLSDPDNVGLSGGHLRHGVAPKELKFRPTTRKSDVGVMGTLADPSNRVLSKKEGSHSTKKSFSGDGDKKYCPPEGEGEIEDDLENRNDIVTSKDAKDEDNKQSQDRFLKSVTKEPEEDGSALGGTSSTRSQTSIGSFSFDIKSASNDVAIAVGIINGLDLFKVRDLLYGPNKSTNERMERSLDAKVTIVGRDFDYADPSVQLVDDWNSEGPYVLVRGSPKCVRKAVKVVSHLLCEAAHDGEAKDRVKTAIVEATAECAIISGHPIKHQGDCAGRRNITSSGEESYYASMNQDEDATPTRKYPFPSNNSGQNHTYRINFPSWMNSSLVVGRIVGKKGQNVNKLCGMFNCSIDTFGASTARSREHLSDPYELPNLVCLISGPDKEQIEKCRLHIESIAVRSVEPEWCGRFEYDLAVANELGYEDHFCYYENPRDGSMVVHTYSNDPGNYCYMTCIDVSRGVVEAPKEILGDLEELGKHTYCQIYLEGSIDEPHLHIVGDTLEGTEWAAHEIYQRLTAAAANSSTAVTEKDNFTTMALDGAE